MRLVAERLARSFGPRRIFGPLSFAASQGSVLGIIGPNGSGKTTLVKTLNGLIRPSAGRVVLEPALGGGPVLVPRDRPDLLGWCAPDLALYGELTPAENLEFFARASGKPRTSGEIARRLDEVGLSRVRALGTRTRFLSTGQRQRLKLAFSTLGDPRILFLDEPGSNLDDAGRTVVAEVVARQKERGLVVLASNDPRELELATERVSL